MTDFFTSKKILITGAGGFIGSHLTQALVDLGSSVKAFVHYNSRGESGLLKFLPEAIRKNLELLPGDLLDEQAIDQAAQGADLIFHLGALIPIPYSYFHPTQVIQTNILGTLNVLNACRRYGCRLVATSTSEVYGSGLYVPINEDHPLQAQSPYSASKIAADKLAESYCKSFDVQAVIVRPFNTYGPRQSARAIIPTIITQALALDTISLGNLDTTRDFTYVSDTVNGFIAAAQADSWSGDLYNLGTGSEITIGKLAEIIIKLIGRDVSVQIDNQRLRPTKSEVMRLLSDNSRARRDLGWEPTVSLEQGLALTIGWLKENLDQYRIGSYEF